MARKNRTPRKVRKAIAIIGEGISEQEYFICLKRNKRYSFKIKPDLPQSSNFIGIFKKAKDLIRNDDFDFVYCLIDVDCIFQDRLEDKLLREFQKLIKSVGKDNVELINSNPCFEVWFLFHFLQNVPNLSTDSAVSDVLRNYIPFTHYDKSKRFFKNIDIYKVLEDKVNFAIDNAKKVTPRNNVSYTEVYKVFEELEKFKA